MTNQPPNCNSEALRRMAQLLRPEEVGDLANVLESVLGSRGTGYGSVTLEIRNRRIARITRTETVKPAAK
mgnify:CR=1 FL=1